MGTSISQIRSAARKGILLIVAAYLTIGASVALKGNTLMTVPVKAAGHFNATFVGGPTVILEIGGLRLMTDPTLDPAGASFETRGKNVVHKLIGPAIQNIGKIDIVLLSHDQHPDNLDSSGRASLSGAGKVITTKGGASRLGGNAVGLDPWESMQFTSPLGDKISITAVPARHGPYIFRA